MFKKFYPREYYSSAFSIDFQDFYDKGYRAVLFDIDNTLVGHDAPYDENAVSFFKSLRKIGFKSALISNNDEKRVEPFANGVGCSYVCHAKKPDCIGYQKAMILLETDTSNTLFVGDQIFTDIWGANKANIYSVLVKPMGPDPIFRIRLKRKGEKIILFFYRHYKCRNIKF